MATIPFTPGTAAALDGYIQSNFPDAGTSDEIRTGVALALWADKRQEVDLSAYQNDLSTLASQVGITPGQDAVARTMPAAGFRYYDVEAIHDRAIPDLEPWRNADHRSDEVPAAQVIARPPARPRSPATARSRDRRSGRD